MKPQQLVAVAVFAVASLAAQSAELVVTVVDRQGKPVQDAVVVVVPQAPGKPERELPAAALINQQKMQFVPALTIVGVGARVGFSNTDSWEHHVRGTRAGLGGLSGSDTGGFEMRLEARADGKPLRTQEIVADKPGAFLLGCHIHASMRGHLYVSDSPWTRQTQADGRAVFDDLPAGAATVRVWQADQLIDLPAQNVTLGAAPMQLQVPLQVVPRRRRI